MRAAQSSLPDAKILPSGEKAMEQTPPRCPLICPISLPEARSQSRIGSRQCPAARVLPSGEKATGPSPPSLQISLPEEMSQTRIVPSLLAAATVLLSGENATDLHPNQKRSNGRISFSVSESQRVRRQSLRPLSHATTLPSEDKATA